MTDALLPLGLGALAGLALGAAYFTGLWLTVRRVANRSGPRTWLLVSFALRTVLTLAVFVLLARQGAYPLLGALLGFIAARPLVTRFVTAGLRVSGAKRSSLDHEEQVTGGGSG